MREVHLRTPGPAQTRALAAAVAEVLRPGDVLALTGELGAGKTCFVQGAAAALGVSERVTSPSFVLRRDYDARIPVVHLDVYRLDNLSEVADLALEDVFDPRRVTFVEWGDAMSPLLPSEYLEVEFAVHGEDPEEREVTVRPHGGDWLRRLQGLQPRLVTWAADRVGER